MQRIQLKQGELLVDDADFERIKQFNWSSYCHHGKVHYALTRIRTPSGVRTNLLVHRFIMNALPGQKVDHKNGNGLDCRRENLRFCNDWQNSANRAPNGDRRFKGITKDVRQKTKPWRAVIRSNGHTYVVGYYRTDVEAAAAYDGAAHVLFGNFARTNVSEPDEPAPAAAEQQVAETVVRA